MYCKIFNPFPCIFLHPFPFEIGFNPEAAFLLIGFNPEAVFY